MSIDINLVNKVTSEGNRDLRLKKIKAISFVTLFAVAIFSIVLFLIGLRFSVNYVVKQQSDLIKTLSTYDPIAAKIILLNSRLEDISSIINQRKMYHKTSSEIVKNIPSGVTIQTYEIGEGKITIEATSSSLSELNNFLNQLIDLSKTKTIKNVLLEDLSIRTSVYVIKIQAT